jgi:hypothetical protein
MNVLLVTTAFPRWVGDVEGTFILDFARALTSQGLSVRVLAMHSPRARRRETLSGV